MRYGMALGSAPKPLPAYVETIERYEEMGLDSVWSAQLFGADALTVFALAGATTSRIQLGTAVIPTYSRHPLVLASQALTTQAATGNRLVLGVGSSHRDRVEGVLGADYEKPAQYLREYLGVLPRLLEGERFDYQGERVHVNTTSVFGRAGVVGAEAPPVYVGTMFPISLRAAGEFADGVITWLVGPTTLAEEVIPRVRETAASAGRPQPRVVAGIPITMCAKADTQEHTDLVNSRLESFVSLPVYKKVLDREGATGPSDLAAIGAEQAVVDRLQAYANAGVDEVYGVCFADDDALFRTAGFLGSLDR